MNRGFKTSFHNPEVRGSTPLFATTGTFEINIFNETRENLELAPDGASRDGQIGQWEEVIKNIKGAIDAGKVLEMTEHVEEYKFDDEGSAGKGECIPEETITKPIE